MGYVEKKLEYHQPKRHSAGWKRLVHTCKPDVLGFHIGNILISLC